MAFIGPGQTLNTGWIGVPAAAKQVAAAIDGTQWPPGTSITGNIDWSEDSGQTWQTFANINITDPQYLIGGECRLVSPEVTGTNSKRVVRANITVTGGSGITLQARLVQLK